MNASCWIYFLTNFTNVSLYVGITNNLSARLAQHKARKPGAYTNRYNAFKLVYHEAYNTPAEAIAREKQIKGWKRDKKNALVAATNPEWLDISVDWQAIDPSLALSKLASLAKSRDVQYDAT